MASRWRKRPVCRIDDAPAALRQLSATGATLDTDARPALGSLVTLAHPEAGAIIGEVVAIRRTGIRLKLSGDAHAMGFALAAITADMSAPR